MIEIIRKRIRCHNTEYFQSFVWADDPHAGYSFICDKEGRLEPMNDMAAGSYLSCRTDPNLIYEGIRSHSWSWVEPAIGLCRCGTEVDLSDSLTNSCEGCGQLYNGFGQELRPESEWEENYEEDY